MYGLYAFKVSIPVDKKAIVNLPVQAESEFLFGDNLDERLEELKKKNKLKKEFEKSAPSTSASKKTNNASSTAPRQAAPSSRKYDNSGNERSHQKSQAGSWGWKKKGSYNKENREDKEYRKEKYSSQKHKKYHKKKWG